MKQMSMTTRLTSLVCSALLSGGCSPSRFARNIWVGFSESVGAVPTYILIDYINTTFISDMIDSPDGPDPAP